MLRANRTAFRMLERVQVDRFIARLLLIIRGRSAGFIDGLSKSVFDDKLSIMVSQRLNLFLDGIKSLLTAQFGFNVIR